MADKPTPPNHLIRESLRSMPGYRLTSYDCPVKLNQNESPYEIPGDLKRRILDRVCSEAWGRYPEPMPTDLVGALANHAGVDPGRVVVSNGSNTLVQHLLLTTITTGTRVVIPSPSFSLYGQYVTICGGQPVFVDLDEQFGFDTDALHRAIAQEQPGVVILCAPNNPTGCDIDNDSLIDLLEATDGFVVVDEAYGEFTDRTAVDLLDRYANLVVLKTLSKAFGGAGIRIGYLIAHPDIVAHVLKVKLPFDINTFSRIAALELLEHADLIREHASQICQERTRLFGALEKVRGITPYPTSANLILFDVGTPDIIFDRLVERGVLVRNVSGYPNLSRCLRVSVGTPEENDTFLEALQKSLGVT
jgi:histidinol-phosphate aminotransferase